MITVAVTGHTRGLGQMIHQLLQQRGHTVLGFSLSSGHDLRDWSQRNAMIDLVRDYDWFVNCAKPDYAQSQILYQLMASPYQGQILNVGSPVVHRDPGWRDLGLLEYLTQKVALYHAHSCLDQLHPGRMHLWEPEHAQDIHYVARSLTGFGL